MKDNKNSLSDSSRLMI